MIDAAIYPSKGEYKAVFENGDFAVDDDLADLIEHLIPDCQRLILKTHIEFLSHTITVSEKNDLKVCGLGRGTILKPAGDFNLFEFKAPCSRCSLSDMQFFDEPSDPKHKTASMIYFNHSGKHGAINEALLENICMYYPFNGVNTSACSCDIENGIQTLTVRNIRINQYRNLAFTMYNCFDSVFDILFAQQKSSAANHGFYIRNSLESGSYLSKITMLGRWNTLGNGFHFDNVSHVQGGSLISDTMNNGVAASNEVDDVILCPVELRSSGNNGLSASHNKGVITLLGVTFQNNQKLHAKNFGYGGKVRVFFGSASETHGSRKLVNGDLLWGVEGLSSYP